MEAEQKRELRLEFRKEREQSYIPSTWLHVSNCAEIQRAHVIASYISYELEPETKDLNLSLINSGKTRLETLTVFSCKKFLIATFFRKRRGR